MIEKPKGENKDTASSGLDDPPCSALGAGDVVQRGDLFLGDSGNYLEMDNLGRLLGIRCLGQTLKKSGAWFRPLKQNTNDPRRKSGES